MILKLTSNYFIEFITNSIFYHKISIKVKGLGLGGLNFYVEILFCFLNNFLSYKLLFTDFWYSKECFRYKRSKLERSIGSLWVTVY